MPTTLQSAGVNVTEIDLTTIVPSVATTEGAIAGVFRWGPIGERVLVDSEQKLALRFGKPTSHNPETFFTASSFLAYGNRLYVSRAANTTGGTANDVMSALANTGTVTTPQQYNIKNEDHYETLRANGDLDTDTDVIWVGKYPGAIGNSLKISVCDSANAWNQTLPLAGNSMVNATASVATAEIGSNTVTITVYPAANTTEAQYTAVNVLTVALVNSITVGDILSVGNNTIGKQLARVTTVGAVTNSFYYSNTGFTFAAANTTVAVSGFTTANFVAGMVFGGANVAVGTTIASITNSTSFELSAVSAGANNAAAYTVVRAAATASITLNNKVRTKQDVSDTSIVRNWEYFGSFDRSPAKSDYLLNLAAENPLAVNTAANDELHVVVVDEDGQFSGVPGTILERFAGLSRVPGAKNEEGVNLYYADHINQASQYAWWANDRAGSISNTALLVASSTNSKPLSLSFAGGADGEGEGDVNIVNLYNAYDLFIPKLADVSLIMQGKAVGGDVGQQLANYIIDNICEVRKDVVLFVSPNFDSVINNQYQEVDDVIEFRNAVTSSSYAVMDSGYKYMYDRYNDVYRWIPLNGDIAGLCARTDHITDPWYSPAGLNRGIIKNVIKLAYNPAQAERDSLYKNDVNPVIASPGTGPVLYGDKTLLGKPSAFDRINVRRLFITIEKAIATAAKYTLFEFNDAFTRAQFRNLIEPYLRDVQGRRGIYDFRVICDESNNTPDRIDRNEMYVDIAVKPVRAAEFIYIPIRVLATGAQL